MARWEPDAPGRLQQAAFDLYVERGYDQTTVAEIATRAGLTERTFFRHFADKREVLFVGGDYFNATVVQAVDAAPPPVPAMDAVTAGIEAAGSVFPAVDIVRRRQALILANPELHERELIKLASLATALSRALCRRGVPDTAADLAAEAGVAVLRIAITHWIDDSSERPWTDHVVEVMGQLQSVTAPSGPRRTRKGVGDAVLSGQGTSSPGTGAI